jgi:hypothetical protein
MTAKPALQKILQGILYTEMKVNIVMKGWELLNLKRIPNK